MEGKDSTFVVVDRVTKYAHFCKIQSTYTTSQVENVFMKEIHKLRGLPKVKVTEIQNSYEIFEKNYGK